MTNKNKASEIALKHAREYTVSRNDSHKKNILFKESSIIECENVALEMAEWKQQQVIEWLSLHAEMYGAFNHGKLNEMVEALKKAVEE